MSITAYHATWMNIPEELNLHKYRCGNSRSCRLEKLRVADCTSRLTSSAVLHFTEFAWTCQTYLFLQEELPWQHQCVARLFFWVAFWVTCVAFVRVIPSKLGANIYRKSTQALQVKNIKELQSEHLNTIRKLSMCVFMPHHQISRQDHNIKICTE